MSYKTVCVAGGGVLGSQIAFQAAYCGFDVTIWLRSEGSIGRTQPKIDHVREEYIAAIEGMADGTGEWCAGIADSDQTFDREAALAAVERAYSTLKLELDLAKAVADADLVIESMAEDTQAKIDFYKKLAPVLPQKTVIVTNSSTLLPSTFAKYTGRPEKYLSLHFANSIWKNNMTEVMAQDQTDKRYFDELVDFANDIRMLALPVNKEKNGYLLNSMLVPWLLSGLDLYVSGVSDPKSIDLAWTRGTGAPKGPFRVFDTVGIQTAYNIVMQYQKVPGLVSPLLKKMMMPYNFKAMASVLKQMLEFGMGRGDLVIAVGGGVVGDLAGFAASIYMRGIDFINCPTTTLSMIDSSIGGKTAVDLGDTKNIVGAFWQPKLVIVDPDTLSTLPRRHFINGLAEAVKASLLADPELFAIFENGDVDAQIGEIICRSLRFKKNIVEQDETEQGMRKALNFGHTIGHGIEAVKGIKGRRTVGLYHGECVALGMLPMIESKALQKRVRAVYRRLGLPTRTTYDKEKVLAEMLHDKKAQSGQITIIKVPGLGCWRAETIPVEGLRPLLGIEE